MTASSVLFRETVGMNPSARAKRRTFTGEYKVRILSEYEALPFGSSDRGALLRAEGLYASHIAEWRKTVAAGSLDALAPKPKAKRSSDSIELDKSRRREARLEAELSRTWMALEIMGKAHALLEMFSESADIAQKPKQ